MQNSNFGASIFFIYFMMGFIIGAVLMMVLLAFIQPYLPMEKTWARALGLAPLFSAFLWGWRVATLGKRHQVSLWSAIKASFLGA